MPKKDMPALAENVLHSMYVCRYKVGCVLGCVSALKAVATMG